MPLTTFILTGKNLLKKRIFKIDKLGEFELKEKNTSIELFALKI